MSEAFEAFDLHPQLLQAVDELEYETPTPIQDRAIPALLAGRDVLGQARFLTFTVKTNVYISRRFEDTSGKTKQRILTTFMKP